MDPEHAIAAFMMADHARIDALLRASERADGTVDETAYTAFRGALLRHIAMEERSSCRGYASAEPTSMATEGHGQIAKLLVRSPSRSLIDAVRAVLSAHDALEEGPAGLYEACDTHLTDDASDVVDWLRRQPEVPLARYYDGPEHRR